MARASADSTGTRNKNGSSDAKRGFSWRTPLVLAALVFGPLGVAVAACSTDSDLSPRPGEGGSGGGTGTGNAFCTEGTTRDCSITLGQHNGILTCLQGTQACVEGVWGACIGDSITQQKAPQSAHVHRDDPVPFAGPSACLNNPCDPSCQVFNEDPDAGITPDAAGSIYDWQTGDLNDFPKGLVSKGLKEPCSEAADCQFNMQCESPTSNTCSHHKCSTGIGLYPECDPCVKTICTADPSCCLAAYGGACAHDPCLEGVGLKTTCSNCVKKVCQQQASCCTGTWDASCIALYEVQCNKTCSTVVGNWSQSCVDKVYSLCGAECKTDPPCSHNKCYSGDKLTAGCDPCVAQICQASPYCCTDKWDNLCVDKVKSLCGESCPAKGVCTPWLPGETDPNCPGVDLSVGVPCNGVVPVCNHGQTDAVGPIRLVHFPANSQQYPLCTPDQTHPGMMECSVPGPIPAGTCVDVDANACGIGNGNREIMINPPKNLGNDPYITECFCENNWSLSSGGNSCAPPDCSSITSRTIRPVNMFVQFDRSGSMTTNDRWGKTTGALKAFFADPASAGMGVALRFWEHYKPVAGCDDTACDINACSVPLVPLAPLTAAPAPADTQEQALIDAINVTTPAADTPMLPALAGATQWAKAYQNANPNQQTVVVFVTDGYPNSCGSDPATIASYADDAFVNAGVLTYAIGIQDANVSLMNLIAQKGGTGTAFFVSDQGDTQQQMLSALLEIKGDVVACEFDLPNAGLFDPGNATVTFYPTNGNPTAYPQVLSAAACGNGWYYNDPLNPTKILLCPTTCQNVLASAGASIDVALGCPGSYEPATFTNVYQASCPTGTKVQWGYFAYDSVTPGDSNLVFAARTATTAAQLSGPYTTLATAHATPSDTQLCAMAGPSPCPIDVYNKLALPAAQQEFLEFSVTFNPTANKGAAPTLNGWEITYSCVDSE